MCHLPKLFAARDKFSVVRQSHFVFRVDASQKIGFGHYKRCLALAKELCLKGVGCTFVSRDVSPQASDELHRHGIGLQNLKPVSQLPSRYREDNWLGISPEIDGVESAEFVSALQPAWLVCDNYSIDATWEEKVKSLCQICVIDDLADRHHIADVLVDSAPAGSARRQKYGQLAPYAKLLLGPKFAMLDSSFVLAENVSRQRNITPVTGFIRRILVYFGGGCHTSLFKTVADVLAAQNYDFEVFFVPGDDEETKEYLRAMIPLHQRWHVLNEQPSLAVLMQQCDLALGSLGSATWERCFMGLPSITVSIADNQRTNAEAVVANGCSIYLGFAADVSFDAWLSAIEKIVEDKDILSGMTSRCVKLVDGRGASRVASALIEAT